MHFGSYRVGCEGAGGFFRGMIRQKIPMPERPSTPAPELLFFAGEKKKPWRTFGGGAAAWGDANYIYLCIMEEVFEDSLEATCTGRILMLSPHNFLFFCFGRFLSDRDKSGSVSGTISLSPIVVFSAVSAMRVK